MCHEDELPVAWIDVGIRLLVGRPGGYEDSAVDGLEIRSDDRQSGLCLETTVSTEGGCQGFPVKFGSEAHGCRDVK